MFSRYKKNQATAPATIAAEQAPLTQSVEANKLSMRKPMPKRPVEVAAPHHHAQRLAAGVARQPNRQCRIIG